MSSGSLEQRVAALEAAMQKLLAKETTATSWLQRLSGILAHEPEFRKVIEYGRYWRQHDPEPPDPDAPVPECILIDTPHR